MAGQLAMMSVANCPAIDRDARSVLYFLLFHAPREFHFVMLPVLAVDAFVR